MNTIAQGTALALTILASQSAHALITGSEGNDPVKNFGWPEGSEGVANLKTRIAHWEGPPFGGGQYTFEFRGKSTADFNKALEEFAKIESLRKELIVQPGPKDSFWLGIRGKDEPDLEARMDWSFVVWNAESWKRLYNDPESTFLSDHPNFRKPVAPPKMFVYIGGGTVEWDEVAVPEGVTVIDERGKAGEEPAVTGIVTDIDSGEPIAGVKVTLLQGNSAVKWDLPTVTTGPDGRYVLKEFPIGTYAVVASHDGYAPKRSLSYSEFLGTTTREEDLMLSRATELAGTVRDPDGKAVAGARIIARNVLGTDGFGYAGPDNFETHSGNDGGFRITGLPHGNCRLTVWSDGLYQPGSVTTSYDLPRDKPLVISMIGTGTVQGTLKRPDGRQLTVSIQEPGGNKVGAWGGSMNCKEDGSFVFKNIPVGDYLLGPSGGDDMKPGDPGVKAVTVKTGETVTVEIVE